MISALDFQWKNPDSLIKNPDFLLRNLDFLLKNLDFITKKVASPGDRAAAVSGLGLFEKFVCSMI